MSAASLVVAAAAFVAFADDAPLAEPYTFEPAPEVPGAEQAGAADVARAQKAAKAKQFADAARQLEIVARTWPASVHDCNLALAYLRAGLYVQAKLAWDLSALRNGARPKWCSEEVSTQLSEALRGAKYVPTTIDVTPRDALVVVQGVHLRNIQTIWLPPQPTMVTAYAAGHETRSVNVDIGGPNARISITLEPPRSADLPDAGADEPMTTSDAALAAPDVSAGTADMGAPPVVPVAPIDDAPIRINGTPVGYRAAAVAGVVVGWLGAAGLGYGAYYYQQKANDRYTSDPEFDTYKARYDEMRFASIGAAVLGAVSTGVLVYIVTREDSSIAKPGGVQVGAGASGGGSFGVTVGGSW